MSLGQRAATTVAAIKVLRPMYQRAMTTWCYRDATFPRDYAGAPDKNVINRLESCVQDLSDLYKGTGKIGTQQTFDRKTQEAESVGMVASLVELAGTMRAELNGKLAELEVVAAQSAVLTISNRTIVNGKRLNVEVNYYIKI